MGVLVIGLCMVNGPECELEGGRGFAGGLESVASTIGMPSPAMSGVLEALMALSGVSWVTLGVSLMVKEVSETAEALLATSSLVWGVC